MASELVTRLGEHGEHWQANLKMEGLATVPVKARQPAPVQVYAAGIKA